MKKIIAMTAVCLLLAGCTTPHYTLKHPKTGQIETCGGDATGSLAGGVVGYHIQKSNDQKCVDTLKDQGFEEVE